MRKPAALLLAAALTTGALTTTAHATSTADPAPTNVQIGWSEDRLRVVRVTWDEDAPRPNRVFIQPTGESRPRASIVVSAEAPNELVLYPGELWELASVRIGVVVGTAATTTSPTAWSTAFDGHIPDSELVSISQAATGMTVKWRQVPYQDVNPGDPLDRNNQLFEPMYEIGARRYAFTSPSAATQYTVKHPARDYRFYVGTHSEWSDRMTGTSIDVNHARLSLTRAPVWIGWGHGMVIAGRYWPGPVRTAQRVILHARNSPTSPWYVAATTQGSAVDSTFEFNIPAQSRQYRLAMANSVTIDQYNSSVFYGAYSAPWSTQTFLHVHGSFTESYVRRGQTTTLQVQMVPTPPSGLVALQRWNGKTWAFVQNIPLRNGSNRLSWVARTPGTATYRIYAPSIYYNGLPVAAAYSTNFTLTTS